MNWNELPSELKILSFKDFCIRCEEVYDTFWEYFAPFFDIAIYRDYLLYDVKLSNNEDNQETLAEKAWEFLMGDINGEDLYWYFASLKRGYFD